MTSRPRTAAWLTVGCGVLIVVALATALGFHLVGAARFRAAAAKFEPLGGSLALPPPPAPRADLENDAATWLTAGAGAIVLSTPHRSVVAGAAFKPPGAWNDAERAAVTDVLRNNRAALEILHRAAALETAGFGVDYSAGIGARVPNLLSLLTAARLLAVEARAAAARGDVGEASLAVRTLGRLASALEAEPALIAGLIGIAAERCLLAVAADAVAAGGGRDPVLLNEALGQAVPRVDLLLAVRRALAMDARGWVEAIRIGLDPTTGKVTLRSKIRAYVAGDLESAAYLDLQRELLESTGRPQAPDPAGGPPVLPPSRPTRFTLQVPNLLASIKRFQATAAQRQLVLAALALRREADATGAYPPARPGSDLLSRPDPFTGHALVYEPHGDGSLRLAIAGGAAKITPLFPPQTSPGPVEIVLPPPAARR